MLDAHTDMNKLLILHLNVEQETAVQQLFSSKQWNFCDLAKYISETVKNSILSAADWKLDKHVSVLHEEGTVGQPRDTDVNEKQKSLEGGDDREETQSRTEDKPKSTSNSNHGHNVDSELEPYNVENNLTKELTPATVRNSVTGELGFNINDNCVTSEFGSNSNENNLTRALVSNNNKHNLTDDFGSNIDSNIVTGDLYNEISDIKITRHRLKNKVNKQISNTADKGVSKLIRKKGTKKIKSCQNNKSIIDSRHPTLGKTKLTLNKSFTNHKMSTTSSISSTKVESVNHDLVNEKSSENVYDKGSNSHDENEELVNPNSNENKYQCDKCNYVASVKSNLNRHVREVHSGVTYQCSKCDKSFRGKHVAKMHELHAHSKSLKCEECNKRFSSISGLRNHSKTVHKKKTLYQCQHCKKSFFYKSHYLGHLNKHLGVKPFSCEKCKKHFSYKAACKLHEKKCSNEGIFVTHTMDGNNMLGEKRKYLCDICGVSGLNSKSSLKMHHFYAHSDRPQCVCSLCGKTLKGKYSLRRHMKTQHEDDGTRHVCPVCEKSFNQLQILRQHMKIHNKQYACICDTCGKGFLTKFKLKEHARTHSGEKPFVCTICNTYKSATKTNLQKHMKIHEKNQKSPRQPGKKSKKTTNEMKNSEHKLNITTQVKCETQIKSETQVKFETVSESICSSDSVVQPQPAYLDSTGGNYSNSNIFTEGQRQYTNLPALPINNSSMRYNPSSSYNYVYNVVEDGGRDSIRSQGHDPDYNVGNSDSYYGNESGNESTDLSQGLNILTIAMNIVNPEQY